MIVPTLGLQIHRRDENHKDFQSSSLYTSEIIFAAGNSRGRVVSDPVGQWRDEGEDVGQVVTWRSGGELEVELEYINLPRNVAAHPMLKDSTPISL